MNPEDTIVFDVADSINAIDLYVFKIRIGQIYNKLYAQSPF
jgi:hypothetical protein